MGQIIKHRRGNITQLKDATSYIGELVVVTGSIGDLNGPIVFVGETNLTGGYKPTSRIYIGDNDPTITIGSHGSLMDGIPFYSTVNKTLTLLDKSGNLVIDLTGNIEGNVIDNVTINNITGTTVTINNISGSFTGSGVGLYDIPASGITGLELNRISEGAVTASITENDGFRVNTNSEITGSLIVSGSVIVTDGIVGLITNATTSSYANNADLLDNRDSLSFATTGSNIFVGEQRINTDANTNLYVDSLGVTLKDPLTNDLHGKFIKNGSSIEIWTSGSTPSGFKALKLDPINNLIEINPGEDGVVNVSGDILITGSTFIENDLYVTGSSTLKGATTLENTLTVNSTSELKGELNVNSTLNVTGSSQFKSTINVDGDSTLSSAIIEDLTENRIVVVGNGSRLIDYSGFTYDGNTFKIGSFESDNNGDIRTSGSLIVNGGQIINGNSTVNGELSVTGNTELQGNLYVFGDAQFLGSSSVIHISSSVIELDDNIIRLNAYSPFERYAGFEVVDSGSTNTSASLIWDSDKDYWLFMSSSGQSSKLIGTTPGALGSENSLTNYYFPIATGINTIGNSLLTYSGTTLSFNTNKFTINSDSGDILVTGNVTLSYSGGTDNGNNTSEIMFRNSSNIVGFVNTTETTDIMDGLLGYKNSNGELVFSNVIDGGTY